MIALFSGTGSQEFVLVNDPETESIWGPVRHAACQLMVARGHEEAAKLLDSNRFELQEATNPFGDEFFMLRQVLPIKEYAECEKMYLGLHREPAWAQIASAVTELGYYIRFVILDLELPSKSSLAVSHPVLETTTDTVEEALADAEQLIRMRGAKNGFDRLHTAFHGSLKAICEKAEIVVDADAATTVLFKAIRENHPGFRAGGAREDEVEKICRSLAAIVDALNPLRNRRSLAHANESLLSAPEATLVVNAIRTLLQYLDAKTSQ